MYQETQEGVESDGGAPPLPPRTKKRDPVLAALRGNHMNFSARQRQGAVHPGALHREGAELVARDLRRRVDAGEALAIVACLGTLTGLTPTVVPHVFIPGTDASKERPALYIDVSQRCLRYDLDRVLEEAAKPRFGGLQVRATRWVEIRLPSFLAEVLVRACARRRGRVQIGDLFGIPQWEGRARFLEGPGYRLKFTLARFRNSLGPLLLEAGVRRLAASAALLDFRLGTKSNFAYITFSQAEVDAAVDVLHQAIGWD